MAIFNHDEINIICPVFPDESWWIIQYNDFNLLITRIEKI